MSISKQVPTHISRYMFSDRYELPAGHHATICRRRNHNLLHSLIGRIYEPHAVACNSYRSDLKSFKSPYLAIIRQAMDSHVPHTVRFDGSCTNSFSCSARDRSKHCIDPLLAPQYNTFALATTDHGFPVKLKLLDVNENLQHASTIYVRRVIPSRSLS